MGSSSDFGDFDRSRLRKSMDTLFPQQASDECRVCGESVVDGRWNYCSERCRKIAEAVQRMFVWEEVREHILERDDYTCQRCGLSRQMWKKADYHIRSKIDEKTAHLREDNYQEWLDRREELRAHYGVSDGWARGGFHVDHITPVSEGGHPFDEGNLQTLCKWCHEKKTAEENREPADPDPNVDLGAFIDE